MDLFKALKEKNFADLKDYCENKIAEVVSDKIYGAKTSYLNKLRGIDENTEIIIKTDDKDDHEKAKKSNKGGDDKDDHEEANDTSDGEGDGDKKKGKSFPFAKKDDSKNESKVEDTEEADGEELDNSKKPDSKDKTAKQKKVTGKDAKAGKFADASS